MLPCHRVPQSNLSHVASPQGLRAIPSQVPSPQTSRIKPQSCCHATGFQNQVSIMLPGHRVPESNLNHVPRAQVSRIHRCHVPTPQGSRINPQLCSQSTEFWNKPQSYSQARGFHNQTSVRLPGHSFPPSSLTHDPRSLGSTIKPQSCSQA